MGPGVIQDSASPGYRAGLRRYNLLGKEEPWVKRWTPKSRDSLVLAAYRPNFHGVRAILSDAFFLLNKRLRASRRPVKKAAQSLWDQYRN